MTLPEPADVIVHDSGRGHSTLCAEVLQSIIDARKRLLKPHGTLIPKRDILWAGVVNAAAFHARQIVPSMDRALGLDMRVAWNMASNIACNKMFADLLTAPQRTSDTRLLRTSKIRMFIDKSHVTWCVPGLDMELVSGSIEFWRTGCISRPRLTSVIWYMADYFSLGPSRLNLTKTILSFWIFARIFRETTIFGFGTRQFSTPLGRSASSGNLPFSECRALQHECARDALRIFQV